MERDPRPGAPGERRIEQVEYPPDRFAVYVPRHGRVEAGCIATGSGIVGRPDPGAERVLVYYEGAVHGQVELDRLADRVARAHGRLIERYPTVAMASLPLAALREVGTFDPAAGTITPTGAVDAIAIAAWLGAGALDPAEMRCSAVDHRAAPEHPAPRGPFVFEEGRARRVLDDPEIGELEPIEEGVGADELNDWLETALRYHVIAVPPESSVTLGAYPESEAHPVPVLVINPGRGPLVMGSAISPSPAEAEEDPVSFTLRLLGTIVEEANGLVREISW